MPPRQQQLCYQLKIVQKMPAKINHILPCSSLGRFQIICNSFILINERAINLPDRVFHYIIFFFEFFPKILFYPSKQEDKDK